MFKKLTKENCKDFKNFSYGEFKCKCDGEFCNGYPVSFSYELAKNLQTIRDKYNKPLYITSPLRCSKWNSKVGGVKNSKHTKGCACDFYVKGISYEELETVVKSLPYFNYCYRINKNQDVIHYDINPPEETSNYNLTRNIYFNTKGVDVKVLQIELKNRGYNIGKYGIDGIHGKDTYNATKKFQSDNKLSVDGIVGKNTAHALGWLYRGK